MVDEPPEDHGTNEDEKGLSQESEARKPQEMAKATSPERNDLYHRLVASEESLRLRRLAILCSPQLVGAILLALLAYYLGATHPFVTNKERGPHIIVETLWATPLARTHLRTHPQARNISAFNARLADAVAADHTAFRTNNTGFDLTELNDLFFEYQVGGPSDKKDDVEKRVRALAHRNLPEFAVVTSCAAQVADRLLRQFGDDAVHASKRRLQSWATLHEGGSRHPLHVHVESTLSIVYYVRMGEGAPLRLYDPRGPRPPFEGSVEVWPDEGEMVVFPGWVAHEVDAGVGQRVSLVFNVPGRWEGDDFGGESVGLGRWGKRVKGWKLDWAEGPLV